MSRAWEDIIGVFDEMSGHYLAMIDSAEEKRDALVNVKVEKVTRIIADEEALIKKIDALEKKRLRLVEQIAREGGWTDQKIKLLDLVERAPADFAERMKQVGQSLADIVMRIALLNNINNNLLKQAMHIIEYNINVLSRAQATPFYNAGGSQPQQPDGKGNMGLSVCDRKA